MSKKDKKILKALMSGISVEEKPFLKVALKLGIEEKELLDKIKQLKKKKIIRRFGARISHVKAGFRVNCMACWKVPKSKISSFKRQIAAIPSITHCYIRPEFKNFSYNLYTMVHAKDKKEINKVVKYISDKLSIKKYELLFTVKEYKKQSFFFFQENC